ncbi:MAG: hypothetical protein IJ797_09035 [Selenomonadaceae bacterium]|nr:hypothetical protein [Selenomonadaceae bacterium]
MDFTVIGTIHSHIQQKNLKFAANYKQKTGQSVVSSSGNLNLDLKAANNRSLVDKMIQAQQSNKDEYSKQRVSSIKRKLMSGKKISNEELGYLRKNDPDLYKKAKKAEESREELKSALRRAKTKDEARKAITQAMMKASAEATAELAAAKTASGVAGAAAGGGNNISAGYEASQEIGGPNAEAISNYANGNEPSMLRLNEQITASADTEINNNTELSEAAKLKDINANIAATNEMNAKSAVEKTAAETNELINKPNESNDNAPNSLNNNDSTNPLNNNSNSKFEMSGIMEKFIMVVRALEDEWATFTKSDAYKDLAEDMLEEAFVDERGKHYKKKPHNLIDRPNQQVLDVISAYRSSMLFE